MAESEEQRSRVPIANECQASGPRADFRDTVERLLSGTPPKYLAGLGRVVLRDAHGLARHEKKKRQQRPGKALLGTYLHATGTTPPQIHLFLDAITSGWPPWLLRVSFVREVLVAMPLFHELGHHIHARIEPSHSDRESVASEWSRKLTRDYLQSQHRPLLPFLKGLRRVLRLVRRSPQ